MGREFGYVITSQEAAKKIIDCEGCGTSFDELDFRISRNNSELPWQAIMNKGELKKTILDIAKRLSELSEDDSEEDSSEDGSEDYQYSPQRDTGELTEALMVYAFLLGELIRCTNKDVVVIQYE